MNTVKKLLLVSSLSFFCYSQNNGSIENCKDGLGGLGVKLGELQSSLGNLKIKLDELKTACNFDSGTPVVDPVKPVQPTDKIFLDALKQKNLETLKGELIAAYNENGELVKNTNYSKSKIEQLISLKALEEPDIWQDESQSKEYRKIYENLLIIKSKTDEQINTLNKSIEEARAKSTSTKNFEANLARNTALLADLNTVLAKFIKTNAALAKEKAEFDTKSDAEKAEILRRQEEKRQQEADRQAQEEAIPKIQALTRGKLGRNQLKKIKADNALIAETITKITKSNAWTGGLTKLMTWNMPTLFSKGTPNTFQVWEQATSLIATSKDPGCIKKLALLNKLHTTWNVLMTDSKKFGNDGNAATREELIKLQDIITTAETLKPLLAEDLGTLLQNNFIAILQRFDFNDLLANKPKADPTAAPSEDTPTTPQPPHHDANINEDDLKTAFNSAKFDATDNLVLNGPTLQKLDALTEPDDWENDAQKAQFNALYLILLRIQVSAYVDCNIYTEMAKLNNEDEEEDSAQKPWTQKTNRPSNLALAIYNILDAKFAKTKVIPETQEKVADAKKALNDRLEKFKVTGQPGNKPMQLPSEITCTIKDPAIQNEYALFNALITRLKSNNDDDDYKDDICKFLAQKLYGSLDENTYTNKAIFKRNIGLEPYKISLR